MTKEKTKVIFRDIETKRLITKEVAESRDPNTWTQEEFMVADLTESHPPPSSFIDNSQF